MDVRMKELVSLGASVSAHCFPCFDFHLEQARKFGIGEKEIQESIRAGFMVMNGAGDKMREKIKDAFPEFSIQENESCTNRQKTKMTRHLSMVRF
jgi:AhpD family alkylhydroperoxidase